MSDMRHDGEERDRGVPAELLSEYMNTTNIYQELRNLSGTGENIVPEQDRARAQELARNRDFLLWLTSQESENLLVHGRYHQASHVSGLSILCRCLHPALDWYQSHFIPLVFFCGLHTRQPQPGPPSYNQTQRWGQAVSGPPNYDYDTRPPTFENIHVTGGHLLIRSFINQLLGRFRRRRIPMENPEYYGIQTGHLNSLCTLFSRLVGMLPQSYAIWCIVDGAEYYERDGSWDDARLVIGHLLQLSNPRATGASVRVLITTPTFTSHISEWFPGPQTLSLAETGWQSIQADSEVLEERLDSALAGVVHNPNLQVPQNPEAPIWRR